MCNCAVYEFAERRQRCQQQSFFFLCVCVCVCACVCVKMILVSRVNSSRQSA